jgi:GNAT superfamily N-acetyltransferase
VTSVRDRSGADRERVAAFLDRHNALRVARLGTVEAALDHPALLAEVDGRLVGVLTHRTAGDSCEVLTLHADERGRGVGTRLLDAALAVARGQRCRRLLVVTTNDNTDALRFYQRRGFALAGLRPGAVTDSRARLKPEIPPVGEHGIPLRDEVLLERPVAAG